MKTPPILFGVAAAAFVVAQSVANNTGSGPSVAELLVWAPEGTIPPELRKAATSLPNEVRLLVVFANGVRQHKCVAENTTVPLRTTAVLYARPGELLGDLSDQPLGDDFPPLRAVGLALEDFGAATRRWELRLFKQGVDREHIQTVFGGAVSSGPEDLCRNPNLGSAVREALFTDNSAAWGDASPVGLEDVGGPAVFWVAAPAPDLDHPAPAPPGGDANAKGGLRRRSVPGATEGIMGAVRHVVRVAETASSGAPLACLPEQGDDVVEVPYSAQFQFFGVPADRTQKKKRRRRDEI